MSSSTVLTLRGGSNKFDDSYNLKDRSTGARCCSGAKRFPMRRRQLRQAAVSGLGCAAEILGKVLPSRR
jgi:hypothetical protein